MLSSTPCHKIKSQNLKSQNPQITKSWTLARLDHSQHINYWITFKENKIDIECFTHTME